MLRRRPAECRPAAPWRGQGPHWPESMSPAATSGLVALPAVTVSRPAAYCFLLSSRRRN